MDKIAKALGGGESGTGGVSFVIHMSETTMDSGIKYELDKTWQEIRNAIEAGMYCCIVGYFPSEVGSDEMVPYQLIIGGVAIGDAEFYLLDASGNSIRFSAETKDGYPYDYITEAITPGPGTIDPRPNT